MTLGIVDRNAAGKRIDGLWFDESERKRCGDSFLVCYGRKVEMVVDGEVVWGCCPLQRYQPCQPLGDGERVDVP